MIRALPPATWVADGSSRKRRTRASIPGSKSCIRAARGNLDSSPPTNKNSRACLHGFANSKFDEVVQAAHFVQQLEPGCADGRPLRALGLAGIDSKFFERHRALIQQLLDARFDGQASEQGLESFLAAPDEGDHWLLVAPLQPGLLSCTRQTVPAAELMSAGLPGTHVLIVEDERSLHQLPQLADTVAVSVPASTLPGCKPTGCVARESHTGAISTLGGWRCWQQHAFTNRSSMLYSWIRRLSMLMLHWPCRSRILRASFRPMC